VSELLKLRTSQLSATIDPGLGADCLALVDARTGIDVLFQTPWRARADAVRAGQRPTAEPAASWLEHYRGGWQTLCPVGGDAREVHGAPVGFHGEASRVPWQVIDVTESSARLAVDLFTVPIRIERQLRLVDARVEVLDNLTNTSSVEVTIDYSHHPAFGGEFLDGRCRIETNAATFTPDPDRATLLGPGAVGWPHATALTGEAVDLSLVPSATEEPREIFGWLHDFGSTRGWARIVNPRHRLAVELTWDSRRLPFAWLWAELGATAGFPWFGRARALAIEPATMITGGVERASLLTIAAGETVPIPLALELQERI